MMIRRGVKADARTWRLAGQLVPGSWKTPGPATHSPMLAQRGAPPAAVLQRLVTAQRLARLRQQAAPRGAL